MDLTSKPIMPLLLLFFTITCGADGPDPIVRNSTCSAPDSRPNPLPTNKAETCTEQLNVYCGPSNTNPAEIRGAPQQPSDLTSKYSLMIDNALHLAQLLAIIAGGFWALRIYKGNSNNKSIEVLITLEQEYRKYRPFLLQIEMDYDTVIKPVLQRYASGQRAPGDAKIMQNIDGVLRHLSVCSHARELQVLDPQTSDKMYGYYLRMICNLNSRKWNKTDRTELADYVNRFWPSIWKWASEPPLSPI